MKLLLLPVALFVASFAPAGDVQSGSSLTGEVLVGAAPTCHEITIMPLPVTELLTGEAVGEQAPNSFFHYMLCYDIEESPDSGPGCQEVLFKKTNSSSGPAVGTGCVGFGEVESFPSDEVIPYSVDILNQDQVSMITWTVK